MSLDRKQQITSIFHSAIEREGMERCAFLDGACANDEELRREVDLLIESHENVSSFIDQPAYVSDAKLLDHGDGHAFLGRTIGPYKIISLVGAGGMGRSLSRARLAADFCGDEILRREIRRRSARSALSERSIDERLRCHGRWSTLPLRRGCPGDATSPLQRSPQLGREFETLTS